MKKLKKRIREGFTFFCMVVVLGIQNLIHGSWKVKEPNPGCSEHNPIS